MLLKFSPALVHSMRQYPKAALNHSNGGEKYAKTQEEELRSRLNEIIIKKVRTDVDSLTIHNLLKEFCPAKHKNIEQRKMLFKKIVEVIMLKQKFLQKCNKEIDKIIQLMLSK